MLGSSYEPYRTLFAILALFIKDLCSSTELATPARPRPSFRHEHYKTPRGSKILAVGSLFVLVCFSCCRRKVYYFPNGSTILAREALCACSWYLVFFCLFFLLSAQSVLFPKWEHDSRQGGLYALIWFGGRGRTCSQHPLFIHSFGSASATQV